MVKLISFAILLSIIVTVNARTTKTIKKPKLCTTDSGAEGKCVPIHLCNNGKIITNGDGSLDPRFSVRIDLDTDMNSECEHYLEECCSLNKVFVRIVNSEFINAFF